MQPRTMSNCMPKCPTISPKYECRTRYQSFLAALVQNGHWVLLGSVRNWCACSRPGSVHMNRYGESDSKYC